MMQASRRSVKAHYSFSYISSSVRTRFQVYGSKCWDPYVSPSLTICFFLQFFLAYSSMFILSLPSIDLGSNATSLRPGFCVRRPRQQDTIFCEWNLISCFFGFCWLLLRVDGINKFGWCVAGGRGCCVKDWHQIPSVG